MVKNNKYENLISNIEREKEEINNRKRFTEVEKIIEQKYHLKENLKKRENFRESLSVTKKEVDLAKDIRGKIAQSRPELIPNKSQIYRAALWALKNLSLKEIIKIIDQLE
jgi:hypothetical protein